MKLPEFKSPFNKEVNFGTTLAACFDIESAEDVILVPNKPTAVPTGLFLLDNNDKYFNEYYCVQIMSRSGLSLKGVQVFNAPGIIDTDYKDEIKIILNYIGEGDYKVSKGDRIAQGMLVELSYDQVNLRDSSDAGSTRTGGFGSTGS